MSSRTPDIAAPALAAAAASARGAETAALNLSWAERFLTALAASGVRDVVLCPGSRSAPLALALHRSSVRAHVALDERAGAYFALGLAKGARRPAAVLTTSGTAAANLLPAVVEAFHARVPLIVLTADRPPELRDTGAPQTIDQIKLFGGYVRWFCEVGAPAPGADLLEYAGSLGARAAAEAWGTPPGPVHLNFAFREPLLPEPGDLEAPPAEEPAALEAVAPEGPAPSPRAIARIARALRARRRGLIACGPEDAPPEFAEAIVRLAAATGYPVLADPASQVRYGPHDRSRVLGGYDALLRAPGFAGSEAPEVILQFGAPLTSKAFHAFAALHAGTLHLAVDPAGRAARNPARRAREVLAAEPAAAADALADALRPGADPLPGWLERWSAADAAARAAVGRAVASGLAPEEGRVFAEIVPALPEGALLYVGNSMAIRDLDTFAPGSPRRLRVLAHRGVNGIDGVLSSALGASVATGGPLLLVTGDLSFHHDLTGLWAAREERAPATVLVLNNDGGGIFSFLPVARHGDAFERFFATPHGLDFEPAVTGYGIPFERAADSGDARARAIRSLEARAPRVIELRSDRTRNRDAHLRVWAEAARAVEELRERVSRGADRGRARTRLPRADRAPPAPPAPPRRAPARLLRLLRGLVGRGRAS